MAEERVQRRLAAILAADVVGYSRLMGADEEGTLARMKKLRADVIDPKIAEYRGRIFKTTGDGILAEFPSAVDAVRHAVDVQRTMAGLNADVPEDSRIEFRIGISLGDVMVEGDDLFGNGVNVAARMEGLAEPGSICVSGNVQEHIGNSLDVGLEDLGEQTVKNITEPVRTYRVRIDGSDSTSDSANPADNQLLPLPDKPSIAVLPFENMSGDPEQEYFADGIAEDIITGLSRFSWFFVIARNSSFSYKGTSPDIRRVAEELGVQYVLEGSVRKAANRVRITAQLIEAVTGRHVWAERYDRELTDIFDVQDEISTAITGTIAPEFLSAERKRAERKLPENMDAWDYALRGDTYCRFGSGEEDLDEAIRLFQEAIRIDNKCGMALSGIAHANCVKILSGWAEDIEETRKLAFDAAKRATTIDEHDAWAHANLGWVYHVMRQPTDAEWSLRRALELNPNLAFAEGTLGLCLAHLGKYEEAIIHADRAVRLSPHDPSAATWMIARVIAPLVTEQYEEWRQWAERITEVNPNFPGGWRHLTAAYAYLNRLDEAHNALARLLQLLPGDSLQREKSYIPSIRPEMADRLLEGLRRAGMPEK